MMKHIPFTILFLVLSVIEGRAQVFSEHQEAGTLGIGVRAGFTTSILSTNDFGKKEIRIALIGGVFARYALTERFFLQVDGVFSQRGSSFKQGDEVKGPSLLVDDIYLSSIDLPVTAIYNVRYKLLGKDLHFDLFGGVAPGYHILKEINGRDAEETLNDIDISVVFGAGFTFGKIILYATNKVGLTDIADFDAAPGRDFDAVHSLSTEWTAGYRF